MLGLPVRLAPVEELIWSKAYIQERERYDGADVAHLLLARGHSLDWGRLLDRFGPHWRVLLSHLVLFGFVYPGEQGRIPASVLDELMRRLERDVRAAAPQTRLCQGTLLSRGQYLSDLTHWGYRDARSWPSGPLSREAVHDWSAAFMRDQRPRNR